MRMSSHMATFNITRIYSDAIGESHFVTEEIPLSNAGAIGFLSQHFTVAQIVFRQVLPSYDYDFHNAPQKQYILLLYGGVEIETSLGEVRQFPTGSVLLVEDVEGKGHRTKNLEDKARMSAFVII